jgi:hypothetical protein
MTECDCGARVAKTTHASWCESNKPAFEYGDKPFLSLADLMSGPKTDYWGGTWAERGRRQARIDKIIADAFQVITRRDS